MYRDNKYDWLVAKLDAAEKRAEEAENALADHENSLTHAMDGREDEVHCGCCPALRARVEELEAIMTRAYIHCGRDPVLSADIRAAIGSEEE